MGFASWFCFILAVLVAVYAFDCIHTRTWKALAMMAFAVLLVGGGAALSEWSDARDVAQEPCIPVEGP